MKWAMVGPELYFTIVAGLFFVLAMRKRVSPARDHAVALAMAAIGIGVALVSVGVQGSLFLDAYRVDLFSQTFKVLIAAGLFLVVWLSLEMDLPDGQHPEFYFLLITCSLGMMFIVSSVELLTLYISLELASYSLYVLVPLRQPEVRGQRSEDRGRPKTEGGGRIAGARRREDKEIGRAHV